jgi:hypothetical protein
VRRADNLTTFMCRLSTNLGASTSWTPQGLSRPVMGLLYLYIRFGNPPEDGNLIAETCVGVTNIPHFVNNTCALVSLI